MKRTMAFLTLLFLASSLLVPGAVLAAWSQLPGGVQIPGGGSIPGMGSLGNLQNLAQTLQLSPAQLSKLQPVLQNEVAKIAGIKGSNLPGAQKVKQAQSVRSATDSQVKSILDPSQFKQWQGIRQNEMSELVNSLR